MFCLASQQVAQASYFGYTRGLKTTLARLQLDQPTLPPFAHSRFCIEYPSDCKAPRMIFRGGAIRLTEARTLELQEVNRNINRAIVPERNLEGLAGEKWLLYPRSGDCNDYAVTKRHELIRRGWSARNLLLAEVVTTWGEHHLVLVVRTNAGDLVADSLYPRLRIWTQTPYRWVRVQTPQNPMFWAKLASRTA